MTLSLAEQEEFILREVLAEGDGYLDFVPLLASTPQSPYLRPNHLKPIADLFARAERGPIRACVSVPPRHGKTTVAQCAIVWILLRHPEWTIAYLAHTQQLAEEKSREIKDIATRAGIKIRRDSSSVGRWHTEEGGGLIATGIGGPITGLGARLLIVDDPVKSREEAESALIQDRTYEWLKGTALTRLTPEGSAIVIHTRWHPSDLIGRLSEESEVKWETVNLPAIDSSGNALWPEVWTHEVLDERRRLLGEYDWASQFLGSPRPKGTQHFKDPSRYDFPDVEDARFMIAVDPAATAKTTSDYSVIVALSAKGRGIKQVVDVLEVFRGQVEIPKLVDHILHFQKRWRAPVACEAVGGFAAIPQMLRRVHPNVRILPVKVTADKFSRSLPAAAAWNDGRLRVPESSEHAPWLRDFLQEVTSFTGVNDKHDDQVDALAHGFISISQVDAPIQRGAQIAKYLPFG